MAEVRPKLPVQVCFALPERQLLYELEVEIGSTLHQAITQSGILEDEPAIDLSTMRVGIHGKLKTLDTIIRAGDRVEIYRGLEADPKDARRRRAGRQQR